MKIITYILLFSTVTTFLSCQRTDSSRGDIPTTNTISVVNVEGNPLKNRKVILISNRIGRESLIQITDSLGKATFNYQLWESNSDSENAEFYVEADSVLIPINSTFHWTGAPLKNKVIVMDSLKIFKLKIQKKGPLKIDILVCGESHISYRVKEERDYEFFKFKLNNITTLDTTLVVKGLKSSQFRIFDSNRYQYINGIKELANGTYSIIIDK